MSLSSIRHSIDHTEQASRTPATCSLPKQSDKLLHYMREREMERERNRERDVERKRERGMALSF